VQANLSKQFTIDVRYHVRVFQMLEYLVRN